MRIPTNIYFHQILSCIFINTGNTKHFIFQNSFAIFKIKIVLHFYMVKSDISGFVLTLVKCVLYTYLVVSNFSKTLIAVARKERLYLMGTMTTTESQGVERWGLQETKKW